jgi:hypothetical protein
MIPRLFQPNAWRRVIPLCTVGLLVGGAHDPGPARETNPNRDHGDRRYGLHDGNDLRTLVYNYGTVGRPNTEPSLEWPSQSGHGYAYEFGLLVGAEVVTADGDTVPIISDGLLDGGDYDPNGGENWWGWEPLPGYAATGQDRIALSDDPTTWPADWTAWPGEHGEGVVSADLESYYVMDDRHNAEIPYYPFPGDSTRRGLGIEVAVRGYQFNTDLDADFFLLTYAITNVSDKILPRVVVGIMGDPHLGGAGDFADDYVGYLDALGNDSHTGQTLAIRNLVYAWDAEGSGNDFGIPWEELGWLGVQFIVTPGLEPDGLDNDQDGFTDESQADGIDNDGDWDPTDAAAQADGPEALHYWDPLLWNGVDDDGDGRIDDWGDLDGLSDDLNGNGIPDPGEPDFETRDPDEVETAGLTSLWAPLYGTETAGMDELIWQRLTPGNLAGESEIAQNNDNIIIAGSGYFHLEPGDTKHLVIAFHIRPGKEALIASAQRAYGRYLYLTAGAPYLTLDPGPAVPRAVTLLPNYPNPFNPITVIAYELNAPRWITLGVYDLRGGLVKRLVHGLQPAGRWAVFWDGTDRRGVPAASGFYFYRLATPTTTLTGKMVLVR